MSSRIGALIVIVTIGLLATPATAQPRALALERERALGLEMYTLEGSEASLSEAARGLELTGLERTAAGIKADAVLTPGQRARLVAAGVSVAVKRNGRGQTVSEQAAAQKAAGYNVYRSWDEPGGIRDELYQLARSNPQLVKLVVLGRSVQGREIIALS